MNWAAIVEGVTPEMFLSWLLVTVLGWLVFDGVRSVVMIVHELKSRGAKVE